MSITTKKVHSRTQSKVDKALKRGILVRPNSCSKCGKECKPDGHHESYDRPLDITWLCRSCHKRRHGHEGRKLNVMPKKLEGPTRLIKPRDVARRCDVKPRTVAKWLRDGTLPGVKLSTNAWRVEEGDLERFIASRRVTPD